MAGQGWNTAGRLKGTGVSGDNVAARAGPGSREKAQKYSSCLLWFSSYSVVPLLAKSPHTDLCLRVRLPGKRVLGKGEKSGTAVSMSSVEGAPQRPWKMCIMRSLGMDFRLPHKIDLYLKFSHELLEVALSDAHQ